MKTNNQYDLATTSTKCNNNLAWHKSHEGHDVLAN